MHLQFTEAAHELIIWQKMKYFVWSVSHNILSLNTIYFTSTTQKAHVTYVHVLEGADVGILWSYVVEETGVPGGNHRHWADGHYPATSKRRKSNQGRSGGKRRFYPCTIQALTEPPHDKTKKMACAPGEDSDQPGHPSSLIRVFAMRSMGS